MKTIAKFQDTQYPYTKIDHTRKIARGVIFNEQGKVALVKLHGHDLFGDRNYYELPGGGVKKRETVKAGFYREIQEETGFRSSIICGLGRVDDFYNLIFRENHNYYFLGKTIEYVGSHFEVYEKQIIEKIVWVTIDEAIALYQKMPNTGCSYLVKQRELPILLLADRCLKGNKML